MKHNKYIVTNEGQLRFSYCEFHRDMLSIKETSCLGGGLFVIRGDKIECYDKSVDYGWCDPSKIICCESLVGTDEGHVWIDDYTVVYKDPYTYAVLCEMKFDKHGKRITA